MMKNAMDIEEFQTNPPKLGEENQRLTLDTLSEQVACICAMTEQSLRHLRIYTPNLESELYDNGDFASAVSRLARSSRFAEIRILIEDTRLIIARGHALLELHRRLPSSVAIRKLTMDIHSLDQPFMIADEAGIFLRPEDGEGPSFANFCDRVKAKSLIELFDPLWDRCSPDPDLRRLSM